MKGALEVLLQDLIISGRIHAFLAIFFMLFGMIAVLILSLTFLFTSSRAYAQTVPYLVNFQGRLADNNGNALPDGAYNVKLRLFNTASGGAASWEEDRVYSASDSRVDLHSGLFSVQLGSLTSLPPSLFNTSVAGDLYLEIELPSPATATCATNGCAVWSEGPFTPRHQLASSPYAYNSETLGGLDSSAFAQLGLGSAQSGSVHVTGNLQADGNVQGSTMTLTNAGNVTILQAGSTGPPSLTFTLPSATGSAGDCLKDTNGSGLLGFSACAGAITLQNVYDNSSNSPPLITTSSAAKAFIIKSGPSNNSTTAFAVTPDGTTTPTLNVDTQNSRVGIGTATPSATLDITATAAPTVDQVHIDNTASAGVTTAGVSGVSVDYKGGAAAVAAAGITIDFAPGTTSGGTWDGMKIVANPTGPVNGVNEYGLELDGPTSPGAGNQEGEYIGTGWDIGIDIQSGGMQLAATSQPSTPTGTNLRIWAQDIAGRIMPKWMGAAGVDTPFQASLGFNRVSWCTPAGGSTLATFISCIGSTFTNVGTAANPAPTSTNLLNSTRRATFSTSTTAGTLGSSRQSVLQVWRGNAAGRGGFFYTVRFATTALQSGNRAFVGLTDSTSAPTNVDPLTSTAPGRIGMAINANTGNWSIASNTNGTAGTATNLGASFPVNTTDLYELVLFCAPNGSSIGYRVTDTSTGAQTSGSLSGNIPASTDFLAPTLWITNNAAAAVATLAFGGWYLESDN